MSDEETESLLSSSSSSSNISYDEEDGHLKVDPGQAIGNWTLLTRVGIGQFGIVWTVKEAKDKVVKILRSGDGYKDMFASEIEMLQSLHSKHIVQLCSHFDYAQNDSNRVHKVLVMEYMEKDLFTLLHEDNESVSHATGIKLIRQLLQGLAELEEANIVHLDLKPENILLHGDTLKICDFGTAQRLPMKEIPPYGKTIEYRALEVIMDLDGCCTKADVWSAACIVYEIVTHISSSKAVCLFQPRKVYLAAELEDEDEEIDLNHLYLVQEILGPVPKAMYRYCTEYFTLRGELKEGVGKVVFRSFEELMKEDGIEEVARWLDFFRPMLRYNPKQRARAVDMLEHQTLKC
jgi:serine/threonine protein kinase